MSGQGLRNYFFIKPNYHPNVPMTNYHPNVPMTNYHPNVPMTNYHPNVPLTNYHPNVPLTNSKSFVLKTNKFIEKKILRNIRNKINNIYKTIYVKQ